MRSVVRIAAVPVDSHYGQIVGHEILAAKSLQEPLLYFVLIGSTVSRALSDLLEGSGRDRVNCIASSEVRLDLFLRPRGCELRHQIAGTDHVLAQAAHQI